MNFCSRNFHLVDYHSIAHYAYRIMQQIYRQEPLLYVLSVVLLVFIWRSLVNKNFCLQKCPKLKQFHCSLLISKCCMHARKRDFSGYNQDTHYHTPCFFDRKWADTMVSGPHSLSSRNVSFQNYKDISS